MPRDDNYSNYGSSHRSDRPRDDRGYRDGRQGSNGDRGYRDDRGYGDRRNDRQRDGYRDDRGYRDREDDRGYRDDYRDRRGGDRGYREDARGYRRDDRHSDPRGYSDRRRDDRDRDGGYRDGSRGYSDRRDSRDDRYGDRGYSDRRDRRGSYDDRRGGDRDRRDGYDRNGGYRDDRRDGYGSRGYSDRRRDDRGGFRDDRGRDGNRGYSDSRGSGSRGYSDRHDRDNREHGNRGYSDRRDNRGYSDRRDSRHRDGERETFVRTYDDERPLWSGNPFDRRVEVRCPVASRCGGCEWLAMPYDEQLDRKQNYIEELFADFKCEVDPILGMNEPWGYRNKVQLPFAPGHTDRDGRTTARWGIFERGTHHIVPCSACLVEDERARPIIATVANLLPRFNILPYDEKTGTGLLRYVLVRTAHATDQVMVTLVCNGQRIPSAKAFLDKLLERHPEITTVVLNVNRERTSVILGSEETVLMGPGYIEDELCGCRFRISSSSFYQTNPVAAEALYDLAVELAGLHPGDRIGDAYCGTGTIGIVAAKQSGAHLIGVERNADAVKDAEENARLNGIEDAEFITGDAGSVFARMARAGRSLDVVFMDPPRAGSNQAFLANLSRLGPRRVVYISCEPRTQRHDINALVKNGYRVTRICPVDMFPHTDHVENVILLERPKHKRGGVNRRKGDRRDRQGFATSDAMWDERFDGDAEPMDGETFGDDEFEEDEFEAELDEDYGEEEFEGFEELEDPEDFEGLEGAGSADTGTGDEPAAADTGEPPAASQPVDAPAETVAPQAEPAAAPAGPSSDGWDDDLSYSPSDETMAVMAGIEVESGAEDDKADAPGK